MPNAHNGRTRIKKAGKWPKRVSIRNGIVNLQPFEGSQQGEGGRQRKLNG